MATKACGSAGRSLCDASDKWHFLAGVFIDGHLHLILVCTATVTASRRAIHILLLLQTVQVAYRLFLPRSCRSACAFSLNAICRRDFVAFGQWSDQRAGATHSGKAHGDF